MAGTKTKISIKKSLIERTPDGTIELKITIPWSEVKTKWDSVVDEMAKNANLPGFRKGKAPKKLVEEKLDKAKIKEEVVRNILPPSYVNAVREHDLKPIMDPRIHVEGELVEGKDWEFHALTCEAPVVDLAGYKEEIKKVTAKSKIIVPGKDLPTGQEQNAPKFDEIVKVLLETSKISINFSH